jgi:hypothetical protein
VLYERSHFLGDALRKSQGYFGVFGLRNDERCAVSSFRLNSFLVLVALSLLAPWLARSQEAESRLEPGLPAETSRFVEASSLADEDSAVILPPQPKAQVEREVAVTDMFPDGDYRLFSATVRCYAWTAGVEYDRHSWGHFLGSQFDYVVEAIPLVFLSQPAVSDFWGNAKSPNQELVHGVSLSPFGFRLLWRGNKAVKPFVIGKLGTAVFAKKALSPNASYVNFNVQAETGVQIRLSERMDLRVYPFEFFHVSNGYLAASNPGMDELATKFGVSYHLRRRGE